ncbi:hypothetical protein [Nocardioides xinjiangensis]|uniref:hypothetical protein n=1 Tax=Nocardioides xinjiangensis TaxID=2817376 RepID=UPI001B318185|nr:hypothetical protein [Nocardioides sp. SYSU D00514]
MSSHLASGVVAASLLLTWLLLSRTLVTPGAGSPEPGFVYAALAAPVVLGCHALLGVVLTGREWIEWFLGGDNVRHVVVVSDLIHQGGLTYTDPYPRGWHALVSTIWVATHHASPEEAISRFVQFVGAATWGLTALLMLTLGSTAVTVLQRVRVRGRLAYLGVGLAGLAGLLPRITSDLLALGFQTSILSTLVLAVLVREAFSDRTRITSIAVSASCCVLMAHSWQLFLPIPVAILGVAVIFAWPTCGATERIKIVGVAALVAPGCWVPVVELLRTTDVQAVGLPGVAPEIPWSLIVLGSLAFLHVARWSHDWRLVGTAGIAVFAPALTACMLVAVLGVGLSDYYPTKMLGTTAVLSVPFIGASAAMVASAEALPRLTRRLTIAVALVVMTAGVVSPAGALMGVWSTVRADVVLRAIEMPAAADADGVWMRSETETTVVRTLLDVHRPERAPGAVRDGVTLAQECAALRAASRPVVLTTHNSDGARRRYSCAPVSVLRVEN